MGYVNAFVGGVLTWLFVASIAWAFGLCGVEDCVAGRWF